MDTSHTAPKFNWDAEPNDDLASLIMDAARDAGSKQNAALYVLACTCTAFKVAAYQRISASIAVLLRAHGVMRNCAAAWDEGQLRASAHVSPGLPSNTLKDRYTAAKVDFNAKCFFFAGQAGVDLTHRLFDLYEKFRAAPHQPLFTNQVQEFIFDFDWRMMAHAVQRKCFLCSGMKKVCRCATAGAAPKILELDVDDLDWHFRAMQGPVLIFGRRECIDDATTNPKALCTPHGPEHPGYRQWALARALLRAAGKYKISDPCEVGFVAAPGHHATTQLPVALLPNEHLGGNTLAERLRLTSSQITWAFAAVDRQIKVKADEEEAACRVRVAKLRADCDAFLSQQIGETLASMSDALPTLERTLTRALLHFDTLLNTRYIDATEVPYVLSFMQCLVALKKVAEPLDSALLGWTAQELHSKHAYEWIFGLTAGPLRGREAAWWRAMTYNVVDYWGAGWRDTRIYDTFMVSAMHVFDSIGTRISLAVEKRYTEGDTWQGERRYTLFWVLRHVSGWALSSPVQKRTGFAAAEWHAMVVDCFSTELPDEGSLTSQLQARRPPKQSWRGSALPGEGDSCIEEVRQYYEEVAGTLVLFPSTRCVGLLLLGISPMLVANELAAFHEAWATRQVCVPGLSQCPKGARDFALWLNGNPGMQEMEWHPAPPPPPVPPVPEPDDDASDEGCLVTAPKYYPSSPQYEPPSPQYEPSSPQYEHSDNELGMQFDAF